MSNKLIPLVLLLLLLPGCSFFRKKTSDPQEKEPITALINVIDLADRPYITLAPRADGRELTLSLHSLPKQASETEYELEYQAGTLLQGAFGTFDLTSDLPVTQKILLGSCSAGGACSFHQDVQGGTLTLKFRGPENYALKLDWRFIDAKAADGLFSSRDSKLQLDVGTALDQADYVVIMQTSGLPQQKEGEIISGPYGLFTPDDLPPDTTVNLTLRLSQAAPDATILGWDETKWVKFDTSVDEKTATAEVDLLPVYIAVN